MVNVNHICEMPSWQCLVCDRMEHPGLTKLTHKITYFFQAHSTLEGVCVPQLAQLEHGGRFFSLH